MTFHKTKQAGILVVAVVWLVSCVASTSVAQPEESEPEKSEALNTIGISGAVALELDGDAKWGGGGNVSYERELIPKDLQMELVFGIGTLDKSLKIPIGLLFTHAWVPNEVWEPDVGP